MNADFVLNALLRFNYLPRQRRAGDELPPVFSSESFTPDTARNVSRLGNLRGANGYDAVEYRGTRFNMVSRSYSIPHPKAQADLALCIHQHWKEISHITKNRNSKVKPREHKDGRIIIMDYEGFRDRTRELADMSFGCRFAVHTDIANCFPSIYSHAIPWALVGMDHAKANKGPGLWFNQLDQKLRNSKRNETQGIAVGPATSNIMAEIILGKVDQIIGNTYFRRYIDDYSAYCKTEEECQEVIRRLAAELQSYKLLLSIKKTEILPLPKPLADSWATKLALSLPHERPIKTESAFNYINLAIDLSKHMPDASVLKYALTSLLNSKMTPQAMLDLSPLALNLAFHQTALLPLLRRLLDVTLPTTVAKCAPKLNQIALLNARLRRSDGISWCLHYLIKHKIPVEKEIADAILASRDCIALVLLRATGVPEYVTQVREFAAALDPADLYLLDQYWLLLYELFAAGEIVNPYPNDDTFPIMRDAGVRFISI